MVDGEKKGETVHEKETHVLVPLGDNTRTNDTNSAMQDMHVDQTGELKQVEKEKESGTGEKAKREVTLSGSRGRMLRLVQGRKLWVKGTGRGVWRGRRGGVGKR